jgi:hypothetical protein
MGGDRSMQLGKKQAARVILGTFETQGGQ